MLCRCHINDIRHVYLLAFSIGLFTVSPLKYHQKPPASPVQNIDGRLILTAEVAKNEQNGLKNWNILIFQK